MQNGDLLTDSRGSSWIVDGPLGRGLWGRSWALKGEDGTLAVLKVPLAKTELARSSDPDGLAAACASIAAATRSLYEARTWPFLPRLLATVRLADGREGLLLPRYDASLAARLQGGVPLSDVLDLVVRVLPPLATTRAVHGNLRPTNLFVDGSGAPVLTDPAVPALEPHRRALEAAAPERASWLPPEATGAAQPGWDTWALCLALWRASASPTAAEDPSARRGAVPEDGVGKVAIASIKDAAAARLKAEGANKRFAPRAVGKLGAVLSRGLSPEHAPSPPYRFERAGELLERLVEVDELLHPRIESVSRILLGPSSKEGVFEGGDKVAFSVHVGATAGVTAQEDLAVGLQLVDLDVPGDGRVRVDGARYTVNRYPSGKWRFEFELPDVPPGRYKLRVAFRVKDEAGDADLAEGTFEVRPRPGWVPPPAPVEELPPAPLAFPGARGEDADRRAARPIPAAREPGDAGWDDERPSAWGERVSFPGARATAAERPADRASAERSVPSALRTLGERPSSPGDAWSDRATEGFDAEGPPSAFGRETYPPRDERAAYAPERPAYGGERASYGGERPSYGGERPSYGGERPSLGADAGGSVARPIAPPAEPSPRLAPPRRAPEPAPGVVAAAPRPAAVATVRAAAPAPSAPLGWDGPPTSPSLPPPAAFAPTPSESRHDGALDVDLVDYPVPPTATGELPSYDLGLDADGRPGAAERLARFKDQYIAFFGNDVWSATIATVAAGIVGVILVFYLVRPLFG